MTPAQDSNAPTSPEVGSPPMVDLGLGLAFVIGGVALIYGSKDFQIMIPGTPVGPGLLPTICGTLLVIFGAALSLVAFRNMRLGAQVISAEDNSNGSPFFASVLLGGLVLVILLLPYIGFILASSLYGFAVTWAGRASWWGSAIASVTLTLMIYYLFAHVMRVPLPIGSLF
jgi:putative tricarboxylic transport membrane protein